MRRPSPASGGEAEMRTSFGLILVSSALVATTAAAEQTVTVSLSLIDHLANVVVAACAAATVCGGFYVWLVRSRTAQRQAISDEILMQVATVGAKVATEKEEREEDIGAIEASIHSVIAKVESVDANCAKNNALIALAQSVNRLTDKVEQSQTAMMVKMDTAIGRITDRVDQIIDRRSHPRGTD